MEITLTRRWPDAVCTMGEWSIDGALECFTLEPELSEAIPCGRYRLTIERSPHFSALLGHDVFLPRYHDVPDFEGVLVHAGNHRSDTRGCTLLGETRSKDEILLSRAAMERFQPKLQAALDRGEECWVTVQMGDAIGVPVSGLTIAS